MRWPRWIKNVFPSSGSTSRHRASHRAARQAREFARDPRDGENIYQGRRLGVRGGDRFLTDSQRMAALRYARANYKANGMYGQFLGRIVEHTLGDGVVVDGFEDDDTRHYIETSLTKPDAKFNQRLNGWWRETLNEGEYFQRISTQVRSTIEDGRIIPTGLVRWGRFEVEQVIGWKTEPHDPDTMIKVDVSYGLGQTRWYPLAEPGTDLVPEFNAGKDKGLPSGVMTGVFYWHVNKMGPRGAPQFLRILEKVSLVDDIVDQNARKAEIANRFFTMGRYKTEGDKKSDKQFQDDFFAALSNPKPGTVFVGSEDRLPKDAISMFAPKLNMIEQRELYDMAVDFVSGSAGFPKHWFGGGGDTNRATAVEQGSPAHRSLKAMQATLKDLLESLVRYLIWLGKESGRIRRDASEAFKVHMHKIITADVQREVSEIQQNSAMLSHAEAAGYLHKREAQEAFRSAFKKQSNFDVKLDDKPPDPSKARTDGVADIRDDFGRELRESLPLHKAKGP